MNILVTGGAGYLGSILVPCLLDNGYNVTVVDNFMFNQTTLLDHLYNSRLSVVRGDVRDEKLIIRLSKKHDAIIPLACLVGAPLCDKDPYTAEAVNLKAIENLCKNLSKDQQMIYPCTNSGYGIGQENIYCDEQTPLKPISLYGKLKVEAEELVREEFGGVTFRFATLFGMSSKMRLDLLVNDFVFRALSDSSLVLFEGSFKRNYLHVRDAAQSFVFALENYKNLKGESFNIGLSDSNLSKIELCQLIQNQLPKFVYHESNFNEDPDKRNYIVSNEKIEKAGFETQFSLEDGIKELIKGFEIVKPYKYRNV